MSLSLGEKLRQAREERGISISEVAEQTRISSLYLESIENDDYKPLPGGIFNKGFVKSYAKFIGLDEHEALQDYAKILAKGEGVSDELRIYKPEVLTDDRATHSMVPTIIFAGIILALMTGGVLFLVNYIQNQPDSPTPSPENARGNSNAVSNSQTTGTNSTSAVNVPAMETLKVEFRAVADPVSLTSVTDGRNNSTLVNSAAPVTFEPKQSLKLSYSKALAESAQLLINGRLIGLPKSPANPRRAAIEFEINKDNIAQIWQSGAITFEVPEVPGATPEATPDATTVTPPVSTPPVINRAVQTPTPSTTPTPSANSATAPARTPAVPVRTPTPAARPAATATPAATPERR